MKETQLRELVLQLPSDWVNEDEAERIISRLLLDQQIIRELEFGSFDPRSLTGSIRARGSRIR